MQPIEYVDFAAEYGYNNGVPRWIADMQVQHPELLHDTDGILGPGAPNRPDFYLEPEEELDAGLPEDPRPGRNGVRTTDDPATEEDRVYRTVRAAEGLTALEIGRRNGLTRKQANRALYRLEQKGLVIFTGKREKMWFNTVDNPSNWLVTVHDLDAVMDELSKARPEVVAHTEMSTKTRWGRKKVQDPMENRALSLDRQEEDNVLRGFDTHVADAMEFEHTKGDTSYLSEKKVCDVRGGKVEVDFTTLDRKGDAELKRLVESERVFCTDGTELNGTHKPVQQAWNMLKEPAVDGKIDGTHIAAPTVCRQRDWGGAQEAF